MAMTGYAPSLRTGLGPPALARRNRHHIPFPDVRRSHLHQLSFIGSADLTEETAIPLASFAEQQPSAYHWCKENGAMAFFVSLLGVVLGAAAIVVNFLLQRGII